ncbi:MAG: general secretion pathway protein GspK [Deltaproteobacteria bacterium]|jgi:general secretion pathway protein K|nr:general secretion pathway protein GspK [Deltaproteobacteria bacterium]MBW2534107.1 general secretion pathway protein GspK [Deltaproteobacteria bacterium]
MSPASKPQCRPLRRLRSRKAQERGVALIMVLGAIVVLTVFLTEVQEGSSSALAAAIAERDRLRAEYHARSAINLSRLLIGTEPTVRKAIAPLFMMMKRSPPQIPVWEFSDQLLGLFNDAQGAQAFQGLASVDTSTGTNLGLGSEGRFEVVIVDEDSKLNVNVAARGDIISQTRLMNQLVGLMASPQYNPLFENPDADDQVSDRQAICSALIDWADSDENMNPCDPTLQGPSSAGVEDNFYQLIGLPYLRKNAAYDSLEELRLVRGMGDDFWATFVEPDPDKPKKRVLTVWGQGKINVNTANPLTLLALICAGAPDAPLCLDPLQAQTFVTMVTMLRGFTAGAPLFASPKDFTTTLKGAGMVGPILQGMGIQPVVFKSETEMQNMIATESKMFSIYADGVIEGRNRETRVRVHAVVDFRQATDIQQLMAQAQDSQTQSGPVNPFKNPMALLGQPGSIQGGNAIQGAQGLQPGMTGEMTPEQMAQAMATNPAGQVVYWRVN